MEPQEEVLASEKRLELAEFQIRERIEEKLWARVTRWGAIAGVGFTLITIIGVPSLISGIGSSAIKEIQTEISSETKTLSDRLAEDQAKLTVTMASLESDAARAKKAIDEYEKYTAQLENLNVRIAELSRQAEEAIGVANFASEDAQNLRTSIADASAGEPVILNWSAGGWKPSINFEPPEDAVISGDNFSEASGEVLLLAGLFPSKLVDRGVSDNEIRAGNPIILESNSIVFWENNKISLIFTEQDKQHILDAVNGLTPTIDEYVLLSFVVKTPDGSSSRMPEYLFNG